MMTAARLNIVLIAHYFPPVNSSGAKRIESLSKYLAADGHGVTVITTRKSSADGEFTEAFPPGIAVIELDQFGRERASTPSAVRFEPMYAGKPSFKRRLKDFVMNLLGQVPDPRLLFAFAFAMPWFSARAHGALEKADVVLGTAPPWPMLLAAVLCKRRYGIPCVLDYRDQLSECHEMPGGRFAKWLELHIDRWLVRHADRLVTISPPMAQYYRSMRPQVDTIMNGYDHELLERARARAIPNRTGSIVIRYMGIVSPGRVPHNVLRAMVQVQATDPDTFARLRVEFYGNARLIEDALHVEYPSIRPAFSFHQSVPYHDSLRLIIEADYLLFAETSSKVSLSAQGILTTKLFEYIGSGRPVLADISPGTQAGALLVRAGGYHVVATDPQVFAKAIADPTFLSRRPDVQSNVAANLSRRAQATEYGQLLHSIRM